jgi:glucan-binding YG repeat protein
METGWKSSGGKWYLLNSDGSMSTGWQQVEGKWYFLYSDGSMASNTTIGEYRVNESGEWY